MWMMFLHLHNKSDDDDDSKPLGNISTNTLNSSQTFLSHQNHVQISIPEYSSSIMERNQEINDSIYRFIYMSLILKNVNAMNLEEQCCSKVAEKKLS